MNANALPIPTATRNGPNRFAQKCPCTGAWVVQRIPTPMTVIPNAITSFAEPFVTSSWETPANSIEVIPADGPREAALQG